MTHSVHAASSRRVKWSRSSGSSQLKPNGMTREPGSEPIKTAYVKTSSLTFACSAPSPENQSTIARLIMLPAAHPRQATRRNRPLSQGPISRHRIARTEIGIVDNRMAPWDRSLNKSNATATASMNPYTPTSATLPKVFTFSGAVTFWPCMSCGTSLVCYLPILDNFDRHSLHLLR